MCHDLLWRSGHYASMGQFTRPVRDRLHQHSMMREMNREGSGHRIVRLSSWNHSSTSAVYQGRVHMRGRHFARFFPLECRWNRTGICGTDDTGSTVFLARTRRLVDLGKYGPQYVQEYTAHRRHGFERPKQPYCYLGDQCARH